MRTGISYAWLVHYYMFCVKDNVSTVLHDNASHASFLSLRRRREYILPTCRRFPYSNDSPLRSQT